MELNFFKVFSEKIKLEKKMLLILNAMNFLAVLTLIIPAFNNIFSRHHNDWMLTTRSKLSVD